MEQKTAAEIVNNILETARERGMICVQCGLKLVGRGKRKFCSKECSDLAKDARTEKHNESMRNKHA